MAPSLGNHPRELLQIQSHLLDHAPPSILRRREPVYVVARNAELQHAPHGVHQGEFEGLPNVLSGVTNKSNGKDISPVYKSLNNGHNSRQ